MSLPPPGAQALRVLVRGATARDDAMTVRELERAGIAAMACNSLAAMLDRLSEGAGALLVAEESLNDVGAAELWKFISEQPSWSDLPLLVLARHGADSVVVGDAMALGANVIVLERPMRIASLISAVRAALRARGRQYQSRELLAGLEMSDRRKTEFLATLAHELRNPLAPISTCVGILQRDPGVPAPVLEVMERQVKHMVRLVDDLLELSRITRGTVELRCEHVQLAAVIANAVETSKPLMDGAGHVLEIELPTDPLWVFADPVRLAQVLSNLLNNAARYTNGGGRILLRAEAQDGAAIITVTDNGVGLSPDMLASIFDMFSQVDSRDIRAQHGLGIGLALVRSLVTMHGGTIGARSEGLGQGSEFRLRLPLAEPTQAQLEQAVEPVVSTLIPERILVVDDNRDAADALAALLGLAGAQVQVAYDGPQALKLVEEFHPRVAVLDIGMPGMSGLDVARQIRKASSDPDCALIALTGWGQQQDRDKTREAGFDYHMTKPVDFDEMQAVLAGFR